MVFVQAIEQWAYTVQESACTWDSIMERRAPSKIQKAEAKLYGPIGKVHPKAKAKQGFNFSDLDAVVAVLTALDITTLKLGNELPFANQHSLATASLGKLTHIELLVHLGWQASTWQRFCNELLRKAAPILEHLKLSFQHNPAALRRKRAETSLATIVRDIDFPKLQSLEFRALELPEELPYVPQIIDFIPFLSRCKNLELLRTSRVYPSFQYTLIQIGPDDYPSMDDILLDFEGEARVVEELDESIRAWEISVPNE